MKTVILSLGMFLQAIAALISLIAGAVVLIIASLLGKLTNAEERQSNE